MVGGAVIQAFAGRARGARSARADSVHGARRAARFDAKGGVVPLRDQQPSLWDHAAIAEASELLVSAARLQRPGPYQLQAAIVACHAEARSWETTDWPQILALYDALLALAPSPVASLNRAIAVRFLAGARVALDQVDALGGELSQYRLFHATRAELLRDLGSGLPRLARPMRRR